jgi:hypothetical protein
VSYAGSKARRVSAWNLLGYGPASGELEDLVDVVVSADLAGAATGDLEDEPAA